MNRNLNAILVLAMVASTHLALAADQVDTVLAPLSLAEVWKRVVANSEQQQANQLTTDSVQIKKDRSERHWYPKVYLDMKSYRTSDPGANFFGLIEQKSVQQSDFVPAAINQPDTQTFTRGALGLDLPLYEGGAQVAVAEMNEHSLKAQVSSQRYSKIGDFSEVAKAYGTVGLYQQQKQKIEEIFQYLQKVESRYQVGNKSNPVGYSGLLGMKSLINRIKGVMDQYQASVAAQYDQVVAIGYKGEKWRPNNFNTLEFINQNFSVDSSRRSAMISQVQESTLAHSKMTNLEKAKFLPQVGAFAESYQFRGSRDTAGGSTVGLYLRWSLLNPSEVGAVQEARLKTQATEKSALALEQREMSEAKILSEQRSTLVRNLKLMEDSQKLLTEQTVVAEGLFKNGSINALQFVETLNRRVDLILQETDLNENLLKVSAQLVQKGQFVIPVEAQVGE